MLKSRGSIAVMAVVVASLALSACGTSSSSPSTSHKSKLTQFVDNLKKGQTQTFGATWTYVNDGKNQTVALSQKSPKSMFKVDSVLLVNDGSNTYYCATTSVCIKGGSNNPINLIADLFSGKTFITQMQSYTTSSSLSAAGYTVTFSSQTWGGIDSNCAEVTKSGSSVSWCEGKSNGILTWWASGSNSFTITSYTSSPPSSDFQTPPGAHIISL